MFSMCSELTPRAPIPDTRIPQLMQPCRWVIPDRKHQLILPCAGGYHTVVPDCRQGGRKNQVDWFLPGCGPEQWSISANVQHIVGGRSCTLCLCKCPPPPSPKLESIGRPRRAGRPLYILMSSISSHWTIPAPLTLRNFISLGQSDQRYVYHADC